MRSSYPDFDLYKSLGVPETASEKLIKSQYRRLMQRFHPDKPTSLEYTKTKFPQNANESDQSYETRIVKQRDRIVLQIGTAYEILTEDRAAYDAYRKANLNTKNSDGFNTSANQKSDNAKDEKPSGATNNSSAKNEKSDQLRREYFADGSYFQYTKIEIWPKDAFIDGREYISGDGQLYDKNGKLRYEGSWAYRNLHDNSNPPAHGNPQGDGTYYFENGDVYTGRFDDGKMNGLGRMNYAAYNNGEKYLHKIYQGHWKNGQKHGFGDEIWLEENTISCRNYYGYEGEWKDGEKHGHGNLYGVLGSKTSVDFDKLFHPSSYMNLLYAGEWKNNKRHGHGRDFSSCFDENFKTLIKPEYRQHRYAGEWKNDVRHGKGTEYWGTGDEKKETSYWENGKQVEKPLTAEAMDSIKSGKLFKSPKFLIPAFLAAGLGFCSYQADAHAVEEQDNEPSSLEIRMP